MISGGVFGVANLVVAWLLAILWIVHLIEAARGMPKVVDVKGHEFDVSPESIVSSETGKSAPKITIVVPARNEAHTIEPALRSLRKLEYPHYEVIAVNDRSEDETGAIMERVAAEPEGAPVRVVHVAELPPRWLGKTHAMWMGAKTGDGEWVLFTDADVVFRPDALRRTMAYAERDAADHLVLFPTMLTYTPGERMMIALFQALIGFGHRPWKVADSDARDYLGVGAFNMIRRSVYEKIGTYERLRLAIMDDMQLGYLVKKGRFRQRCVFGKDLTRIHWAVGAMGVVRNVTKNFFAYVRFNIWFALAAVCAMSVLNVLPFVMVLLSTGAAMIGYLVVLLCVFAIYAGMAPKSDVGWWYFFTYPIGNALFAYAMLLSAVTTIRQGGVVWRGTMYSLDELKKGLD